MKALSCNLTKTSTHKLVSYCYGAVPGPSVLSPKNFKLKELDYITKTLPVVLSTEKIIAIDVTKIRPLLPVVQQQITEDKRGYIVETRLYAVFLSLNDRFERKSFNNND